MHYFFLFSTWYEASSASQSTHMQETVRVAAMTPGPCESSGTPSCDERDEEARLEVEAA